MNKSVESVRSWSAPDEQFFRSTAELFPPEFLWGSRRLLGGYDPASDQEPGPGPDPVAAVRPGAAPSRPTVAVRAAHLPPCG
jgi:hypothetical protein